MDQLELQRLVERISLEFFSKPFRHRARFNHRLRTTGGRYLLKTHDLEFNPKQLEVYGLEEFIKIIKHELCHYHLHLAGKGYRHGDRDFKELLKKTGGSRYCKALPGQTRRSNRVYLYTCTACGKEYVRRRKVDLKKYVCGACRGPLVLTEMFSRPLNLPRRGD